MQTRHTTITQTLPANILNRRKAITKGLQWAGLGMALPGSAWAAFDNQREDEQGLPFEDMPRTRPNRLDWEMLSEWLTPKDQVFNVQHYGMPEFDKDKFSLSIGGLVGKPMTLTMDDIRAMPRKNQHM
ncbi:MAG: molybdopterin-dependent oxidoreductase, partial [Verrucomicrobia bacterium]|nr:molybdopterin-dependent oxidoreductase [Verrucomicrobiota bacterium]